MLLAAFTKKNSLANRLLIPTALFMVTLIVGVAIAIFIIFHQFALTQVEEAKHNTAEQLYSILNQPYLASYQDGGGALLSIHKAEAAANAETYSRKQILQMQFYEDDRAIYDIDNSTIHSARSVEQKSKLLRLLSKIFIIDYSGTLTFKPWNWRVDFVLDDTAYYEFMEKALILFICAAILLTFSILGLVLVLTNIVNKPLYLLIETVQKGKNKSYTDIREFAFLSSTISNFISERLAKEEALQTAKEDAILASRIKSEFLANMSHEIRTPLNAIIGFIDILKEEKHSKATAKKLTIIKKSSRILLQVIEDILDFSKIESGKLEVEKLFFPPLDEFRVALNLFASQCSAKDISLKVNVADKLPPSIETDPHRLKQVFANLLSNAIKFTSAGKRVSVSISYSNKMLSISVKDEGKGIASDKLEHIFEAFSQEDSSTTRQFGGTGLGLTICNELVKLLGGELKVKSELGVGSEFYFTIPAEEGGAIQRQESLTAKQNFTGFKVLVVEDNSINQMLIGNLLKNRGLIYDFANDGSEGVSIFKANRYDLVLMDENMPTMSGIEAVERILAYEKENNRTHTPIVALTANAIKGDRERFLAAGMDEYLAKPIDTTKLNVVLSRFLRGRHTN